MAPLIADGAMGTELLRLAPRCARPAELNLSAPDLVLGLHRAYLAAGAQLLVANTLLATPDEARAGVRLALQAARESDTTIPMHDAARNSLLAPYDHGQFARDRRTAIVAGSLAAEPEPTAELVAALGEADLLILETVTSLDALRAAAAGVREASTQPLWATFSFGHGQFTPEDAAATAIDLRLQAFGYGCGLGPDDALKTLRQLRRLASNAVLIAKPAVTPAQAVDWADEIDADVIGLCCGSSPAQIRAIADRLGSQSGIGRRKNNGR